MSGERTEKAFARIDLALDRITAAAGRAEAAVLAQGQRNDRLRQAVAETLRDLDALIQNADAAQDDPA